MTSIRRLDLELKIITRPSSQDHLGLARLIDFKNDWKSVGRSAVRDNGLAVCCPIATGAGPVLDCHIVCRSSAKGDESDAMLTKKDGEL